MKIAEHDLAVKVDHMREFLEKRHSVKLWVKTKVQREEHLAAERKKQLKMLEEVAKSLEDVVCHIWGTLVYVPTIKNVVCFIAGLPKRNTFKYNWH